MNILDEDDTPPSGPSSSMKKKKFDDNIRVSITFKLGSTWRGTRSRDFPGRRFFPRDRDILQQWGIDFRSGMTAIKPEDTNIVDITSGNDSQQRKFPSNVIDRANAFTWFRETQERLIFAQWIKESHNNESEADAKVADQARLQALRRTELFDRIDEFHPNVLAVSDDPDESQKFIEIHWAKKKINHTDSINCSSSSSSSSNSVNMSPKKNSKFYGFLRIGQLLVPSYIMGNYGEGSYLRVTDIPPGKYTVNGASLTILHGNLRRIERSLSSNIHGATTGTDNCEGTVFEVGANSVVADGNTTFSTGSNNVSVIVEPWNSKKKKRKTRLRKSLPTLFLNDDGTVERATTSSTAGKTAKETAKAKVKTQKESIKTINKSFSPFVPPLKNIKKNKNNMIETKSEIASRLSPVSQDSEYEQHDYENCEPSMPTKRKLSSRSTTGYTGVYTRGDRYYAQMRIDQNQNQYIGTYDTKREAAIAYDRAIIEHNHSRSKLNFPDGIPVHERDSAILKRRRLHSNNNSGFRGVSKVGERFVAKIYINRIKQHLGTFDTAKEAAVAYDTAVIDHNLPTFKLNFPENLRRTDGVMSSNSSSSSCSESEYEDEEEEEEDQHTDTTFYGQKVVKLNEEEEQRLRAYWDTVLQHQR
jgi:hypothetical protein